VCGPEEGHCEKRCEIQGGSQEMAKAATSVIAYSSTHLLI